MTVAIPNYNYAHFLPDAIGSALDQTDVDVDLASSTTPPRDDSVEVVQEMARNDSRVTLIRTPRTRGKHRRSNEGARSGTGE